MNTILKGLLLTTALACSGIALAAGADPVIGTWKLDAAKSKMAADNTIKSQTRVYTQSADGITVTITSVGADGKEATTKATYKLDGKVYPATGSPLYDGLSGKQVDAATAEFSLMKGGKAVGATKRVISADGRTLTSTGTAGGKDQGTLVFDKQ
jgi:hypothetical protein